jgi:hypothetical protein
MNHFKKPAGDTLVIEFSAMLNVVPDGCKVASSISRSRGEEPLMTKQSALIAGGSEQEIEVTVTGNTVNGAVYWEPDDTRDLYGEYVWDIVLLTQAGDEITIDDGTVYFSRRVTRLVE